MSWQSTGPVDVQMMPLPTVHGPFRAMDHFSHRQVGRRRIFVQTDEGDVVGVELDRADNASKVKKALQSTLKIPTEHSSLMFAGHILEDMSEVGRDSPVLLQRGSMSRCSSSPCLSPAPNTSFPSPVEKRELSAKALELVGNAFSGTEVKHILKAAEKALNLGISPVPATGGLGGAYYFCNRKGESLAIVKPTDEEPFAPNNPNGYVGRSLGQPGLKRTIRVGEAGFREVAAYLLDHGSFARVPPTALVKATHPIFHVNESNYGREGGPSHTKLASLQQYVVHDFDASEHGTSGFPVAAVHRIAILDMRILNTDRHSGNILVREVRKDVSPGWGESVDDSVELIPIDHGFCLPESLESAYFEWQHWPQASLPFSPEELEYIAALDPVKECEMLRRELPVLRDGCHRILTLSTTLLQRAAAAGLTAAEIGAMMSRELRGMDEEASQFENLCLMAKQSLEEELIFAAAEEQQFVQSEASESIEEEHELPMFDMEDHDEDSDDEAYHESVNKVGYGREPSFSSGLSQLEGGEETAADCLSDMSALRSALSTSSDSLAAGDPLPLISLSSSPSSFGGFTSPLSSKTVSPCSPLTHFIPAQYKVPRARIACLIKPTRLPFRSLHPDWQLSTVQLAQSPTLRSPTCLVSLCKDGVDEVPHGRVIAHGCVYLEELHKAFPSDGSMDFTEMGDSLWRMYIETFQSKVDETLAKQKQACGNMVKRFGTSCRF